MADDQLERDLTEESGAEENMVEEFMEEVAEGAEQVLVDQKEQDLLQAALEEARAKADEYLDGWQRARAEFANYRKRMEREQSQIYQTAAGNLIKRYLDIVDDLDLALKNRPEQGDGASWANGIELIYRKLLTILENEGVTPMQADGKYFDPNLHEAITSEPSEEYESGQIIEVLKQGYMLGERVLRPAIVRVAQ
jgi:molecular chaperone GrpE